MDLVARVAPGNFGFVDPDCYVFNTHLCDGLETASRVSYAAAPFAFWNDDLALKVPDTFLISINKSIWTKLIHQNHYLLLNGKSLKDFSNMLLPSKNVSDNNNNNDLD